VMVFTVAGFWWLEGYQQILVRYYQPGEYGLERPYGYWVWTNLATLAIALGPAVVAGLRRVFAPGTPTPLPLVLLCGAVGLGVLVANLSGLSKGEVERIWLPFRGLAGRRRRNAPAAARLLVACRPGGGRAGRQPPDAHHLVNGLK